MTPAPRCGSDSRKMEASGEVKREPAALLSAGKEGGRLVKRKRVGSEPEQNHKRSHGASSRPSKPKSVKDVNSTAGKRKRASSTATEAIDPADESAMNAAQALFELFGGSGTSPKVSPDRKSCNADGVKWAGKKSRSSRSSLKKADDSCACKVSSSSTTSATVTDIPEVLDSSASHNHHVAVNLETVNLDDESEADADAKSTDMSPCGLGFDRCHRLLSQSSVESTLLDSRAESPSSPLRVLRPEVPLLPKLEEEMMLQFGFLRQTPVRPLVKPSILRKPKAEETFVVESDELKEVKIALNKVQRRKPRGASGTPSLLLHGDSVLDVPITSAAAVQLKECIEENKFQVPITLNLFEPVKPEPGSRSVKLEPGRDQLYQTGSFTQGRLRTALSEAEKEARRLRRVQANRESARQTIRRKQVLCEELARKAGELQTEKENLAQSLEQKTKELRNHQEINRHLNDQILLQATGSAEVPLHSSTRASNVVTASSPVPPSGGPGMQAGMPLIPYWWAFTLAQIAAATSQSPSQMPAACEPGVAAPPAAAPDMNTVIAATVAAFNSGAGMNANLWVNMMGNMAQGNNKLPGMVAEEQSSQQPAAVRPTPASESTPPPLKPAVAAASIAMAATPAQPLARSQSLTRNGYPLSPMKSGTFDPMLSRSPMNGNSMSMKTNPRGKYQTSNGPLIRSSSGMSQMTHHVTQMTSADGTSTALSLGLATQQQQRKLTASASNLRFFPSIGNGVQGFLGPRVGGAYQSEAAALATEARRRRRELKRTKSLQTQLQQEKKLASVKSL